MPHTLCETQGVTLPTSFPAGPSQQCLPLCSAAQIKAIKRKLAEVVYYFKQEIKTHKTFKGETQKQVCCRTRMPHLIQLMGVYTY